MGDQPTFIEASRRYRKYRAQVRRDARAFVARSLEGKPGSARLRRLVRAHTKDRLRGLRVRARSAIRHEIEERRKREEAEKTANH